MTRIKNILPALLLVALAGLAFAAPALALDLNPGDYFELTYSPITFDKTQVVPGEEFHTTIQGEASCYKDIPVPVSQATLTSRVIARSSGGAEYTLNPGFTVEINPFPKKAGETYDINEPLAMKFPSGAAAGEYQVLWQLVEAKIKYSFFPATDVSNLLPKEQAMGSVNVTAPATTTPAAPAPATSPPATVAPLASPSVTVAPATPSAVQSTGTAIASWFIVLLAAGGAFVVAAVIAIVLVFLRRR
jgi:hypothetical protein